jgi:hypothetical protein
MISQISFENSVMTVLTGRAHGHNRLYVPPTNEQELGASYEGDQG